jgi:hypothetical protein
VLWGFRNYELNATKDQHRAIWHERPPIAKIDLRPWRSQIEALLLGIVEDPAMRLAMLEAFEEHGLLAYTDLDPEIAVDGFGRLRRRRVDKALETFDESLRRQVVSVFEKVNAIDPVRLPAR